MDLTFLGGADEVGASSTLIRIGGKNILVDAGIRISPGTSRGIQNDQLPDLMPISQAGGPDYILVTHAHTDHTGALALVLEQYPHVPLLATRPTIELTRILQADAQRIMKSKQEAEGELPIFDEVASERLMNAFQEVQFRQPIRLGDGLQVTYHVAGHIAGAASLVLEGEEGVLVMSGDVSLSPNRAVNQAEPPRVKADALVLESTYGGKLHANRLAEERRIIETLKQIIERGGKALIPAFALGRAQEVLQILLAYRDEFDVPVYADGMVRAVCQAYSGFQEWLPESTVKAARAEDLFFREKVKPVMSSAMRQQIIDGETPCVVVASSGMLTGGASVTYAKQWAGDARNAILLTGYQDEEAPGRFLQRMVRDREAGRDFNLRIDNTAVSVRCEVGTYSLSAHADEQELVNLAEAMNAEEVLLVHGDPAARYSLATALRQRGRRVHNPRIGQTIRFAFAKRPWALGQVRQGQAARPVNAAELWQAVKDQAGSFFSARELAQMWWGDAERQAEVVDALRDDLYFVPDWRDKRTFQVQSAEQVARKQAQRAIMLANPDIINKLVVLRDSNGRPRVGIVQNASADSFEALVYKAKGRHYPADALLWVIGAWTEIRPVGEEGFAAQMNALITQATAHQEGLLPFARRQQLAVTGEAVNPAGLLPDPLPEGLQREIALLSIVLSLAQDGASLHQNGLLPKRAQQGGPVEQNQAREIALNALPPEARLRKVGLEVHRKRLTLSFDFPARAQVLYTAEIEAIEEQTNWEVQVNPAVNQQALGTALLELAPTAQIKKGPSFHMDKQEVHAELLGVADLAGLEQRYYELTGFRLRTTVQPLAPITAEAPLASLTAAASDSGKLEINAAYALARQLLEPVGLNRVGLKQESLVLSFISPQMAERHPALIQKVAEETGYPVSIHPNPNQQQILQIAGQLALAAGWQIRKGPGIHVDKGEVSLKLLSAPEAGQLQVVMAEFEQRTGYRLLVEAD